MTHDEIDAVPDWAIREAEKRTVGLLWTDAEGRRNSAKGENPTSLAVLLAASLIAKHEEQPISDELRIAREAAAQAFREAGLEEAAVAIEQGDAAWPAVRAALRAIELWKAK